MVGNLTHIFLHSYIWTINSYESIQLISSILKPIIWYIPCIAHVLTLIVYTIEVAAWTLVGVWYEKLPQKRGIWQKCRVKSPIVPNYPCTGVVIVFVKWVRFWLYQKVMCDKKSEFPKHYVSGFLKNNYTKFITY